MKESKILYTYYIFGRYNVFKYTQEIIKTHKILNYFYTNSCPHFIIKYLDGLYNTI